MSIEKNTKDIADLRKDIDAIKKVIGKAPQKRIYQTDFSQHIEDLDKELKRQSSRRMKAAAKVNSFVVGQQVRLSGRIVSIHAIAPGTIKLMACKLATPSIKKCDKNTCAHEHKNYIWVQWSNGKKYVYNFDQLELMTEEDLKPKIGKELSGRIGPWVYDADKKTWKLDGSDKEYTNEEFEDYIYWETHPYDKEEGLDFIKALKRDQAHAAEIEAELDAAKT